jgi:hypothetical protein
MSTFELFEPPDDEHDDVPLRINPAPALSFVPMPEAGEPEASSAPGTTPRLRFVPMDALGDEDPDAEPVVIPLRTVGWSVRERIPVAGSDPATQLTAASAPLASLPDRRGRRRMVVIGAVSVVVVLCSTAVLRHVMQRNTGAIEHPPVASAAQGGVAVDPAPTAAPQATVRASTPAPTPPPAVRAPVAMVPTPASTPRATAPPTPAPTPVPSPRPSPTATTRPIPTPTQTRTPSPTPHPSTTWKHIGTTGSSNSCPGGAVEFGGCTYTVTVTRGGTLGAAVSGFTSSTLKLKIRDASGQTLASRYVSAGQTSTSAAVGAGTYRVTIQELTSGQTSAFTLTVTFS